MDGYYVRRATNEDAAQCLRLIKEGYMSHVKPIYHAALTKGYNNHLKALVLGLAVAAWTVHMGGSPLMAVAYGAIAYISYLLIMFGFVYTQVSYRTMRPAACPTQITGLSLRFPAMF